jgi:hypothetical protein
VESVEVARLMNAIGREMSGIQKKLTKINAEFKEHAG